MSKQQIDEMARKMCRNYQPNGSCAADDDTCQLECVYGYCAGYRKQEWISVDERLPENSMMVITCNAKGEVDTDYYGYWGLGFTDKTVTHWMPLPEPPKGE